MSFLSAVFHWLTTSANWTGPDGALVRMVAQLELSGVAIAAAAVVGVGLGFFLGHSGRGGFIAVNAANAARAVPSLALLVLLVIWPSVGLNGGGFEAAFLAMVALAIPPVLTNAYVAMREVDPDVVEAAKSVGMSSARRFFVVEVPLAAPLAVAGLRTAAVEVVATSTLAAYVTFSDLGSFIFAGLNTNNNVEAFGGALLVALLAGAVDLVLRVCYRLVTPAPLRRSPRTRSRASGVVALASSS
jgi:osmoprotectant transport system permease protein